MSHVATLVPAPAALPVAADPLPMPETTAPRGASELSPNDFRQLMASWCTGVAVVTGAAGGEPVGCTVNAVTSVSLEPPLLLVSLAARVCAVDRLLPVADHVLVVAEPVWWRASPERRPLVCYGSSYWTLWSMGVVGAR